MTKTFATRLARYCARNAVALERLTYDRAAKAVTYRSDKADGPTAGTEAVDPLEFLARALVHIPDKGQVTTQYYGWYANRRGMRGKAARAAVAGPPTSGPEPGHVACLTPARRHPDSPLRTPPPTPRDHAGPLDVRGQPTGASDRSPLGSAPALTAVPGALKVPERERRHAATRQSVLVRAVIAS